LTGAAHVIIVSESRAVSTRDRVGVVSAPGETISPASDVRRARGRLAAVSLRSERAAAAADRAEHALVARRSGPIAPAPQPRLT